MDNAACFCPTGAIAWLIPALPERFGSPYEFVELLVDQIPQSEKQEILDYCSLHDNKYWKKLDRSQQTNMILTSWNDQPGRSKTEVLALFNKAIGVLQLQLS